MSRFTAIRDAFQVLKDPAARFAYDKTLLHQLDMQVSRQKRCCRAGPGC